MNRRAVAFAALIVIGIASSIVIVAALRSEPALAQSGNPALTNTVVVEPVRIVELEGRIVRLDARTGELFEFSGSTGRNARGTFDRIAPPVTQNGAPGLFDIQRAGDATFLVNVLNGDTFILRLRDTNAAWIEVRPRGG